MKPDLKAGIALAFFLASPNLHAGVIDDYRDNTTRANVYDLFSKMSSCKSAVEKRARTEESIERAGMDVDCLLDDMATIVKVNRSGTIVAQTTREKEGVALTLVLRPSLLDARDAVRPAKKLNWFCGASPKEALKFVPEECRNLVDPQEALGNEQKEPSRTLNHAIVWNDATEVERLVAAGVDINKSWRLDGDTPLITAIQLKHDGIVKLLLSRDADVNKAGRVGVTPLMLAAKDGNLDMVKALLERGADVHAQDAVYGESALHYLAQSKDADKATSICDLLLEKGADVNARNKADLTPLHAASARGTQLMAAHLLSKGALLNARGGKEGVTPLIYALGAKDQKELADYLIDQGAEFVNGSPPLSEAYLAAMRGYPDIFRMALARGGDIKIRDAGGNLLHVVAAGSGNQEISKILIEDGLDVDQRDNQGTTPLLLAAEMGHGDLVNILLDKGAKINAKSGRGKTALFTAIENKNKSVAEILIKRGANVNLSDKNLNAPLHAAVKEGNLDLVKLLVENGANVNAEAKVEEEDIAISGSTPLSIALFQQSENGELLAYLLDKGASAKSQLTLSAHDKSEEIGMDITIPLLCLMRDKGKGWKASASLLIAHGADANAPLHIKDYFKDTLFLETVTAPLHFAAAFGDSAVVESLIKHGADVNKKFIGSFHKNKIPKEKAAEFKAMMVKEDVFILFYDEQNGWTPLHFAAAAGNLETVKALLAHGAKASLRDAHSKKAMDYVTQDNPEIARLLAQPKGNAKQGTK